MLVDKRPEYIVLKLNNGEELFGKNVDTKAEDFAIDTPLILVTTQTGELSFAAYMQLSDSKVFTFRDKDVITYGKMADKLIEDYKAATSSIVVPEKPEIIV